MINKKLYKNIIKSMPELHKKTLEYFIEWLEFREKLKKNLEKRELVKDEFLEFKKFVNRYYFFIEKNIKDYIKYKIDYKIQLKYLENDIKFCDIQLKIIKEISLREIKKLSN